MTVQSTSTRNRLFRYLVTCVLPVAVVLLLLRYSEGMKPKGAGDSVTLAFSSLPFAALAQVAKSQGYFQQEGVQVVPLTFSYGKLALDAVVEGKADLATVAETPFVLAVLGGAKVSLLATIHTSCRSHCVLARKDRGVLAPHDLKGKRIATQLGTTAHFFLDLFLLSHSISSSDVELVNLKPDAALQALEQGKVDALAGFDPYVTVARNRLGDRGVPFYDEDIYRLTFNVVGSKAFVAANPDKVRRILRALVRAEGFVRKNPVQAQKVVADFCGVDPAVIRSAWDGGSFRVTLDQSLLLALEDESRWALRRGFAAGTVPNFLEYISAEELRAVKPQAVRILR